MRYGETDQMGYVHHSQFALYLEEARMNLLHEVGFSVHELEEKGIILPVVEMQIRFSQPLHFGDELLVEVCLHAPWTRKLDFHYRIFREGQQQVSRARTILVLAEKASGQLLEDPLPYLEVFNHANNSNQL